MLFPKFGHSQFDQPSPVDRLLAAITGGLDDSYQTQLVLREMYETQYGIFNHEDPIHMRERPLSLVALHPKENTTKWSRLYQTIRRYDLHDIHAKFGLSLPEFLELPRDIVELLFELSTERSQRSNPNVDRAIRELEKGK